MVSHSICGGKHGKLPYPPLSTEGWVGISGLKPTLLNEQGVVWPSPRYCPWSWNIRHVYHSFVFLGSLLQYMNSRNFCHIHLVNHLFMHLKALSLKRNKFWMTGLDKGYRPWPQKSVPHCAAKCSKIWTWPWPRQVWGVEAACLGWFTTHQPKLPDPLWSRCQPGRAPSVLCTNYYRHLKGAFIELLVVIGFMSNQFAPKCLHSFLLVYGAIVHVQITKWAFLS